jgi:phosphatidylserine decarboxylase
MQPITTIGNTRGKTFEQLFACPKPVPHYGFASWDAFFTRKFQNGVREVRGGDNVIISAC